MLTGGCRLRWFSQQRGRGPCLQE